MNVCAKSGTSQLGGGQKSNAMFAGFVEDEQYPWPSSWWWRTAATAAPPACRF